MGIILVSVAISKQKTWPFPGYTKPNTAVIGKGLIVPTTLPQTPGISILKAEPYLPRVQQRILPHHSLFFFVWFPSLCPHIPLFYPYLCHWPHLWQQPSTTPTNSCLSSRKRNYERYLENKISRSQQSYNLMILIWTLTRYWMSRCLDRPKKEDSALVFLWPLSSIQSSVLPLATRKSICQRTLNFIQERPATVGAIGRERWRWAWDRHPSVVH